MQPRVKHVGAPPSARWIPIAPRAALLLLLASTQLAHAMGNHPDSNSCSAENPYYAVCTAGSHDLQGWVGPCRATQDAAQKDADDHAQKNHAGVKQWTGVTHTIRATGYGRNSGLQP